MPNESSFLTEDSRHIGGLRLGRSHRFSKVGRLLVQRAIAEYPIQSIVVCSEPRCLQHNVQALAVVVDENGPELVVDLGWYWRMARRHLWWTVIAYAEYVGHGQWFAWLIVSLQERQELLMGTYLWLEASWAEDGDRLRLVVLA
jgi:hypothetical protein